MKYAGAIGVRSWNQRYQGRLLLLILIMLFGFLGAAPAAAFTVTKFSVDPPGAMVSGTPVISTFKVNFSPSGGETFPSTNELQFSTDLDNARWNYTLILDGIESPQPGSAGRTLNISGWVLAYPADIQESLNVTLEGTAPHVSSPKIRTIVNITEFNLHNNPVGSRFSRTARINPSAAPVANFTGVPRTGINRLTVTFTDKSTGSPTGRAWYFGDENYTAPWTEVNASAGWSAREGFSSVTMRDGSIVLMGGYNGNNKNDVWRSTDNGATWTLVNASAGWSARYAPSGVAMPDGSIVLMGGWDNSNGATNDTWRSTDNGSTWTQMTGHAGWTARDLTSSVAMPDGSIVLMGGWIDGGFKNDVWRSTDNGATWTQVNASAGWTLREGHSSVVMPDRSIVLMGGWDDFNGEKNDVWRSTDNGTTWIMVKPNDANGWSARERFSSIAMPDGSIVLMGGWDYSYHYHDVWRSTDNGTTWTQVNGGAGWSQREGQCSVMMPDGSIVLMGGWDTTTYYNDVWRFQPAGSSVKNPSHTYTTPGVYQVALQVYNAKGYNSTRKTSYIRVFSSTAPKVTGISPKSGRTSGGTLVTIDGTKFTGATAVRFGTAAGPNLTVKSGTKITVRSPAHAAGIVHVTVITPNGTSTVVTGDRFTYVAPPPTVTAIRPAFGIWGTTVQITDLIGTDFTRGAKVYLTKNGSAPLNATNISVISPTNITCTFRIPLYGAIGPWNIRVNTTDGKSGTKVNAFMVKTPAPPTVTGITPAYGTQGSSVQITNLAGTGFALVPEPMVRLIRNNTVLNATDIDVINPNRMTCTFVIPANAPAGLWNVRVKNADGQAGTKARAFTVKVPAQPNVTGITPASGIRGTTIRMAEVSGAGFIEGANVSLTKTGSSPLSATEVTVVSPEKITCNITISPYATTGLWNVRVTNLDQQSGVKIGAFTVET